MKNVLKLEELGMFFISAFALYYLNVEWWYYVLMLFAPDISMLGYLAGNKIGAFTYNVFHHKAIAVIIFVIGFRMNMHYLMITGIILFGHSSLDRLAGYGLKYEEGFKFTHLGKIGGK